MQPLLTAAETRAAEAEAERRGLPASILMENAGTAVAEAAMTLGGPGARFLVVAGPGNNGGDGYVAARKLHAAGRRVDVWRVADPARLKGDAARNHSALEQSGVPIHSSAAALPLRAADVVIDALFGTGLARAPDGEAADAIRHVLRWRSEGVRVLAVDLPSGLSGDTGRAFDPCVAADLTVTFGALKLGLALEPGATLSGCIEVADIGLAELTPSTWLLEPADGPRWLPPRRSDTNKGTYGHLLVVAGSRGKSGAAALSGLAALRSGVGLCTVATPADALSDVQGHAPELMGVALPASAILGPTHLDAVLAAAEGKDALVIGPGIPRGTETHALLGELLLRLDVPVLIDADGLNALAGHADLLPRSRAPVVLTPHPGEMARLTGRPVHELQENRLGAATDFARANRVVVVLKGARTVVADSRGQARVNPTGNPGMATGGTGDVLSGMIGAFLAQGLAPVDAASVGVLAHGLAGDAAARRWGRLGLIASDLTAALGEVWTAWGR
ncbi:MAG TPA: NAD(P)H-hydrate dehydratase [Myxococcaceae bacterium]|nr:NAD(P)H-hydrate dehydratase [Myxococcaceae bacterium]